MAGTGPSGPRGRGSGYTAAPPPPGRTARLVPPPPRQVRGGSAPSAGSGAGERSVSRPGAHAGVLPRPRSCRSPFSFAESSPHTHTPRLSGVRGRRERAPVHTQGLRKEQGGLPGLKGRKPNREGKNVVSGNKEQTEVITPGQRDFVSPLSPSTTCRKAAHGSACIRAAVTRCRWWFWWLFVTWERCRTCFKSGAFLVGDAVLVVRAASRGVLGHVALKVIGE